MSGYESFDFSEVAQALMEIRRQHDAGEPLVWTGPDKLHHAVAASSPEPSWHFSPEGMAHHEDQGRDFEEVYLQVVFQLGFHNGTVRQEEQTEFWKKDSEFWQDQAVSSRRP